jgi:tetratricopeptide (TPR) repeat protein
LYAGGDFKNIYQKDLKSLLIEWHTSVEKIHLDYADSIKAAYFFRRPSIFGKECARVIANLNAKTREYLIHHDYEKAFLSAEQSSRLSKTPDAVFQKAAALFEMRRFNNFIEYVNVQLRDTSISHTLLPLHLRLGDAYWALDSLAKARREYETMFHIHLSASNEEAYALRLEALKNSQERGELQVYFTYSMEDTIRIARLERLTSPIARYLLAREYAAKERFAEGARILESVGSMESKTLEFFRLHRLGKVWFELQEFEKAKAAFVQSFSIASNIFLQLETTEWVERCVWMEYRK